MAKRTVKSRFMEKREWQGECWVWTGCKNEKGYGRMHVRGKMMMAHRAAFLLNGGVIPAGMLVCHKCDNPSCVRPDHLSLGTHKDNAQDKVSKGRHLKTCNVTEDQAREIVRRRLNMERERTIALEFNITPLQVRTMVDDFFEWWEADRESRRQSNAHST